MGEPIHFINVDLDLLGSEPLTPLLDAWGEAMFVLHQTDGPEGGHSVGLEVSEQTETAEATILEFVRLVEQLDPELRARWDRLDERVLDVGIQSGLHPRHWRFDLAPTTVAAIERIGAQLSCTVYAPIDDE